MIYFIVLFVLLMFAFNYDVLNNSIGKKRAYFILCLILIMLAGFRYRVGGDTLNYMLAHNFMTDLLNINLFDQIDGVRAEIGWRFLSSLAKLFGEDFYWLQFIQSTIANVAVFIFFKRYSENYFSAILLYYISFYLYLNFEILRESIAISIFLVFGIKHLLDKRFIAYYITVAVMMLFHTSAVFLFLLPLLIKFSSNNYNYLFICTITYLLGVFLSPFFYSFLKLGGLSFFSNKFDTYLEYSFTTYGKIMAYFLYVLIPLLVHKYAKRYDNKFSIFLVVCAILGSLTSLFTILFRFVNYFTPILILEITLLFTIILRNKRDRLRLQHSFFFLAFVFLFTNAKIITVVNQEKDIKWYSRWYPYYTIFENKEDPDREYIWQKQFERK